MFNHQTQSNPQEVIFDHSLVTPFEALAGKVNDFALCGNFAFAKKVRFIESMIPYLIEAVKDVIAGQESANTVIKTNLADVSFELGEARVIVSFTKNRSTVTMSSDGYKLFCGNFALTPEVLASRLIRLFQFNGVSS